MRKFLALLLFCCFLTSVVAAKAQQTLGSLNGTVLDASGAAVPGSTVTATDDAIGVTRTTKAQANGYFQIFNLPVGTYKVEATHEGFETTDLTGIEVREAQAATLNVTLKVGQISQSVTVTANPMLNATDATNGYTLDQAQIALTPLATGSFTQLAILSPGVNAELLSGVGPNAGLGNQPIWANGQRDTSNTFQVNGVDSTNVFNGKSSSSDTSQRYNFNIGEGNSVGGSVEEGSSVYGSNGNSLPSPPPEFIQELRVNASMYDAQQGATSGAQIDVNTMSGTNQFHGQIYGGFANSALNTAPFFYKQEALLTSEQGIGDFPSSLANPLLHRWTAGGTLGGPVIKDKLFFFVAYQHLYDSDQAEGLSQFNVPAAFNTTTCPSGRTSACLEAVAEAYDKNTTPITLDPSGVAQAMFNATLPNGQYLIPYGPASGAAYQYDVPNVTLIGNSLFSGDQAAASVDYDVTKTDRLSFKYYYQNDPESTPYGFFSKTGGTPSDTRNGAQVGALDNTISIGSRLNWEQRLGYVRMGTYTTYHQTIDNSATGANGGPSFGITNSAPGAPAVLPSFDISEFAVKTSDTPGLDLGPNSTFVNTGYYQNRLNPSTNAIFTAGKHTLIAGGGYSYTQLNVLNNRNGLITEDVSNFADLLEGEVHKSSTLETLENGKNLADRYYRTNEGAAYAQDKWQALSNLSITAGVRWDYHGGFTEKYGNFFNFDPNTYNVTGTDVTGFDVVNDGLVVAGNNPTAPTTGTSASTLTGRQWGISPRVGFAYSPKRFNNKVVINGGAGIYYDRGELFSYLSPPAGGSVGGPFGVTQQAPLVSAVAGNGTSISNPLGTAATLTATSTPPAPSVNPEVEKTALQNQLNYMTGSTADYGLNCGGVGNLESECLTTPLYLGAYDKNNVLPYTINYTLNVQWQPRNDLAFTIGYAGNRGRHAVIPIPFNEPQVATPSSPAQILGASPHSSGETTSYGYDVMNGNNMTCEPLDTYNDPCPIASEPWDTYDGGNSDFRAPYVGYSPYSALFKTVGNSAYDSLTAHVEKRMSEHFQVGASYTYGHALDEQSDIGLFFTGNNPDNLKQSYASSDFDRRQVFTANFQVLIPNAAREHSGLAYLTNDWSVTGITILQSGEPFSLYEYNGAVASGQLGYYPSLINPVLPINDPGNPKSALTGNPGRFRGTGGSYIPAIDPNQIAIEYLTPGEDGVPTAAQGAQTDPVDVYETNFGTGDQRNIFRQGAQRSLDLSFRKEFHVAGRVHIQYAFDIYNVTNTTSMDVPQNSADIGQHGACANPYLTSVADGGTPISDCTSNYEVYGEVITSQADQGATVSSGPPGGGTAGANLFEKPFTNGTSGKGTMLPLTLNYGQNGCSSATGIPTTTTCANNNANLGSVTDTIGSQRIMTMELHITF